MKPSQFDVVLFGASSIGSIAALEHLVKLGRKVMVVGAVRQSITDVSSIMPVHAVTGLEAVARQLDVPFRGVGICADVEKVAASVRAGIVLSSCFPWRLPVDVLAQVAPISLNIHPSPLPAWRGPDPLFWQLRAGRSEITVCVHELAQRIDQGVVVAKSVVGIQATDTESDLLQRIARTGVVLSCDFESIGARLSGHQVGVGDRGAWHRSPRAGDYRIFPTWSVEHATRFISLMAGRNVPFRYLAPGHQHIEFRRLLTQEQAKPAGFSINLADGAIRVLMKNQA